MKCPKFAVLVLTIPLALSAQEFRGTIGGVVTDPTGSVVPGAKVTVTEAHTGTKVPAVSDAAGVYTAPFLLPGDYEIAVKTAGFKEAIRKGVHLGAGDHVVIDVRLDVGDASQSIEVTADAPLINSENASMGQAITSQQVEDLPVNGRSAMSLGQLAMGVIMGAYNNPNPVIQPYDSANSFSLGGTPTQSSEMLLNGGSNTTWDLRSAYSAPQDAVSEVSVKVLDTDAGFGHTRGGTINQVLKSGTNQFHGTLFEFNQPSPLTANSFFNNRNGLGNPVTHFNQYGVTAGGPVIIPRVWNGRNKLFWFFAWENDANSQPNTSFMSVPTPEEKRGDFSQILKADGTVLYDPYSGVPSGTTGVTRTALPTNQIPVSRINPIASAYLKFFPDPNVTGLTLTSRPDGFDNYGTTAPSRNNASNELGRLDYNMSDKSRLSFDLHHMSLFAKKNDYFGNISTGTITDREAWGGSLDEVYTINPSNILNLRFNLTYVREATTDSSEGFDPTSLGFPGYLAANSIRLDLPYISFSPTNQFQSLGYNASLKKPSQTAQLGATWTKIRRNMTFRFGVDARQVRLNTISYGVSSGEFQFTGNRWVSASNAASQAIAMGQDFAQFLYGLPDQGNFDINTYGSWYSYFLSGFAQTEWRVKRNLTITLGARFDHDGPYNEKFGRTVTGWNFGTPNPISQAAIAAYNLHPIAQIPVGSFAVNGGLQYQPNGNSAGYRNTSHLLSPRVGIAWLPERFHDKTVIRASFGMFVAPTIMSYLGQNGNYSSTPILDQEGFSQRTSMTVTSNNYLSPGPATMSDPYPGGAIVHPNPSTVGATTFLGQAVSFLNPEMKSPYSLRWNFGFQQSLTSDMVLELAYIGNHSVHIPVALTQLNGIPRQYLSTLPVRDTALNTAMTASATNPFVGLVTSGTPAGATTNVAQLLSFYPEYPLGYSNGGFTGSSGVLEQNLSVGSSYFHSLNVRLQRRFSKGLTLTGNYIFSKLMEQDTWLNDTDPRPEKRIGVFDHTHRGALAISYQLPFGAGHRLAIHSRVPDALVGGWYLNAIYVKQSGQPFTFMGTSSTTIGDLVYFGEKLAFNPRETDKVSFNTSAFDTRAANQFAYHIRTFSTTFSSLRGDGANELNASMLRRINIRERSYFQLRMECFNVMNRPTFQFPNLAPTNSAFGLITGQSNRSRSFQAGARLVF